MYSSINSICKLFVNIVIIVINNLFWSLPTSDIKTYSGKNVTLVLEILPIVKWNAEFRFYPPRSNSRIRCFCDKCLCESCLLPARLLKYSKIICTSQTKESFSNGHLKLNVSLKYFITDGCCGICWYFILRKLSTALFAKTRTLRDTPRLKSSVKKLEISQL